MLTPEIGNHRISAHRCYTNKKQSLVNVLQVCTFRPHLVKLLFKHTNFTYLLFYAHHYIQSYPHKAKHTTYIYRNTC